MLLKQIYDPSLSQYAYLVGCPASGEAIVIDPERDIDRYVKIAEENDLRLTAVAETHIHADFLAGSREFLEQFEDGTAYLSGQSNDDDWQYQWAKGENRVKLLKHGDTIHIGNVKLVALHTPGHTPEHLSYAVYEGDGNGGHNEDPLCLLSGDFVFVGDLGRPDLLDTAAGRKGTQIPAAHDLYNSLGVFIELPGHSAVLPGHGAGSSCGKSLGSIPFTTVGYEKRHNSSIVTAQQKGEEAFVEEILEGQSEPPMYFARMKKQNRDGVPLLGNLMRPPKIDPEDVARFAGANGSGPMLLDVRPDRNEFMNCHVEHSLHAPLGGTKFPEVAGSYLTPEDEIYLIVLSESDVEDCVRQLVRIGLDHVKGYALWPEIQSSGIALSSIRTIPTSEIKQDSRILDVRSKDEHEEKHIPGANHLSHTRLRADADDLPDKDGDPIVVHCASGARAALAAAYLERAGFDVIYADGPVDAAMD